MEKRLYRSIENKMMAGVCGGIAEYFHIDPTIIRLLCVLLGCTGTGVMAYIACAIIIPEKPVV